MGMDPFWASLLEGLPLLGRTKATSIPVRDPSSERPHMNTRGHGGARRPS